MPYSIAFYKELRSSTKIIFLGYI